MIKTVHKMQKKSSAFVYAPSLHQDSEMINETSFIEFSILFNNFVTDDHKIVFFLRSYSAVAEKIQFKSP